MSNSALILTNKSDFACAKQRVIMTEVDRTEISLNQQSVCRALIDGVLEDIRKVCLLVFPMYIRTHIAVDALYCELLS